MRLTVGRGLPPKLFGVTKKPLRAFVECSSDSRTLNGDGRDLRDHPLKTKILQKFEGTMTQSTQ